jgi:5-methylcytosine-specific restriction protein A
MSHLLYHWRHDNYRQDLDMGVGFHLNQKSPKLHEIERGESLWAFTRTPDGRYALAAELICHQKTFNPEGFRYGRHRVWGDLERSRYFDCSHQGDITPLIRSFDLKTGQEGQALGQSFQGNAAVRPISEQEHQRLKAWAQGFPLETRARLLPEDQLERDLLERDLLKHEMYDFVNTISMPYQSLQDLPISGARKEYLSSQMRTRRSALVRELRELYQGRCQLSGWDPRAQYGADLCEAHHVHWLSRGGDDELHNLVLIAPNYHRLIHSLDAPFDYERRGFLVGDGFLGIQFEGHLIVAR